MKYDVKDLDDGEIRVSLGHYSIASVHYEDDHCKSPLNREEAMKLAEIIVNFIETAHPASEQSEDYEEHSDFHKFMESIFSEICDCE